MSLTTHDNSAWSAAEKISFRFFFVLFSMIIIVANNGAFPFFELIMQYPLEGLQQLVVWLGANVLHLSYPITYFTAGSGDTTYDYIVVLLCFVVALIGAA